MAYDDILGPREDSRCVINLNDIIPKGKKLPKIDAKSIINSGKSEIKYNEPIIYTPYIPFTVTKTEVKVKPRKLKAKWTLEFSNEMDYEISKEAVKEIYKAVFEELGYDMLRDMNEC